MSQNLEIDIYTGGSVFTNGYLLRLENGQVIVIDAPEGIAKWLQDRTVNVAALLLTHVHYDHIQGAAEMKAAFDMPIYSHSQPDDDLTLKSVVEAAYGMALDIKEFQVDHFLEGETSVTPIKGQKFTILHVPGHSPDSLCFQPKGSSVLFGGDVLFEGGLGRSDFPHGDGDLLVQGIREKILTLPDETTVFPGHGSATTVAVERDTNPFLR